MTHSPTPQQEAIAGWFADPSRAALAVIARAGSGKTTTVLSGAATAPDRRVLLAAFNKAIAETLQSKLPAGSRAEAVTLHSAGYRIVRRFRPKVRLENGTRARAVARAVIGPEAPDDIQRAVAGLWTRMRDCLPLGGTIDQVVELATEHDDLPSDDWSDYGWGDEAIAAAACECHHAGKDTTKTGIDFSDMVWLPVACGWIRQAYDLVVVDEAQDMSPAQIILADRLSAGRRCWVGDDRQAIYGFRGADSGVLGRMVDGGAERLPLTITWRCPRAVVEFARQWVPDLEAAPTAIEGEVSTAAGVAGAEPGDAVLSRLNAPLVPLCLLAIKRGVPARIEGRDVLAGLKKLIDELAKGPAARSVPAFLERLDAWRDRQIARTLARYHGDQERAAPALTAIGDKAETLGELAAAAVSVGELRARLEAIFAVPAGKCLVFSTVHKAKGLEWPRVWILRDTFRWEGSEEDNLRYVAHTRAQRELVLVSAG